MPAFLLVYFPSSRTSSVINENAVQSGKLDVGETVSVNYEDGKSYNAEIKYISTKKDCKEKQQLVKPDGTFIWQPVQLTVVSPSPGKVAQVKSAQREKPPSFTPPLTASTSAITSSEAQAIMTVLSRIEERLTKIEESVSDIKKKTDEVIVSMREVNNTVTALSVDIEVAKSDTAEVKAAVEIMATEVNAIVAKMPQQKLIAEELSCVARMKNTATSFVLEVESRLYRNDPESERFLPIEQRFKTIHKIDYLKASVKQFLDIRNSDYSDATVHSVWHECVKAINARVRLMIRKREQAIATTTSTQSNQNSLAAPLRQQNEDRPLSPPHRKLLLQNRGPTSRKLAPGPSDVNAMKSHGVPYNILAKLAPSRLNEGSSNQPSINSRQDMDLPSSSRIQDVDYDMEFE